jgi:hypothetical protein
MMHPLDSNEFTTEISVSVETEAISEIYDETCRKAGCGKTARPV